MITHFLLPTTMIVTPEKVPEQTTSPANSTTNVNSGTSSQAGLPPSYAESTPSTLFAPPGPSSPSLFAPLSDPQPSSTPLDPFSRRPLLGLNTPIFEPAFLVPAINNSLSKGFPPVVPPVSTLPHPFSTNDVTDQDWRRFDHIVLFCSYTHQSSSVDSWQTCRKLPSFRRKRGRWPIAFLFSR